MRPIFQAVLGATLIVALSACGGGNGAAESPAGGSVGGSLTASPGVDEPASPVASAGSSGAATSLSIPVDFPCDVVDEATAEELIGAAVASADEYRPGDQPFGPERPPTDNFGCLYNAEGGRPEFGIGVFGRPMTPVDFSQILMPRVGCTEIQLPEEITVERSFAETCPDPNDPAWSSVSMAGLFGEAAVTCGTLVPTEMVTPEYETAVLGECARIVLALAEGGGS